MGQNSPIEGYSYAFVDLEPKNWVRLLPIIEFAYNIFKYADTGNRLFELNYGYYLCISVEN